MSWPLLDDLPNYMNAYLLLDIILIALFLINLLFAISLIFLERRRSPQSVWAWLLILLFIPIVGFILYMLFGRTIYRQNLFQMDEEEQARLESIVNEQLEELQDRGHELPNEVTEKHRPFIHMMLKSHLTFLTDNNNVETFTNGREKFDCLLQDIRNAKDHIHLQYYIFKKDTIGREIYDALVEKQKEGVAVKVLYDDLGSRSLSNRHFKELRQAGGRVAAFFPSILPLINPRLNNRNHRKIVVIDGITGYVGGFNVGDEYVGFDKNKGEWHEADLPPRRDTHLRVEGDAVKLLQLRFMLDWNSHSKRDNLTWEKHYFPSVAYDGDVAMQIASSGPDEEFQQVKNGYFDMINRAKESLYIQTPYFIPDQSIYEAIKSAILRGVKVHLMIPDHPDHPFVYWATYANAGELVDLGAEVYIYETGFLHAKTIMIDDEMVSIGTTNFDVRSFYLNFEVNAFIFDEGEAVRQRHTFEEDIKSSTLLTKEKYESRSHWIKVKEVFANLISPIL
ncbi:cardiolipin synthase [Lacicoccus alkaliphilus]|uniref:Cardiolipin synthase n=1 Tax=Lacicoccus alkaliphilus DSM 16010 TaxID=1123231 RepID=A0A1M7HNE4_9BACL|nr:cardiolipin synthase [Salinicoccus alkaliphilus]SHM29853.1 cardiolipin synthase [Salinicoccus alkaliphilus DSM 16010]